MELQDIEIQLTQLREKYKQANISAREIIKRQARALEIAKEKIMKRNPQLQEKQLDPWQDR